MAGTETTPDLMPGRRTILKRLGASLTVAARNLARAPLLWLAVCLMQGAAVPAMAEDRMLRVRMDADVRSLDPGTNRDGNTDNVQTQLFEGLVAFREDMSVGPMLAQSVDMSPDGRTYTFTLRPNLSFSDGTALTSADVLFDWHRYLDPKTGWRCQPDVTGGSVQVANVTAPDPHTVVFTLAKPSALFLATLARPDCGQTGIYSRNSLNPDGSWKTPVATGPFRLGEWKRAQSITLLRNEHYTPLPGKRDGLAGNKTVQLAGVRIDIIPDEATAKAALLAGNIDLITSVQAADVAEYKDNRNLTVQTVPTMALNTLLIQTKDKLMSDPRMRRALLLSLDLPALVDQATLGQAQPDASPIPTPSPYHQSAQSAVPARNLALARQLLQQAGYHGEPIRLMTNKNTQSMFDQAVIAQAMAREAGINIVLDVMDWGTQQDRYLAGNFQLASLNWSARLDPTLSFEMFTGDKSKEPRKLWDNKAAFALIAQSAETADAPQRQAIFDKLEAMFRDDIPMIPLYSAAQTSAARAAVEGYKGWALGAPLFWGVSLKQ